MRHILRQYTFYHVLSTAHREGRDLTLDLRLRIRLKTYSVLNPHGLSTEQSHKGEVQEGLVQGLVRTSPAPPAPPAPSVPPAPPPPCPVSLRALLLLAPLRLPS